MQVALFDLDDTLLEGDSDLEWGELLAAAGAMDRERMRRFHEQYREGTIDIDAFLRFQLAPLAREPMEKLLAWREKFLCQRILPRISASGRERVREHSSLGHEVVMITATNRFLTEPIAHELGIRHLLATRPEVRGGRFTGGVEGVPCYREGKVRHLEAWLAERSSGLESVHESWFYTDSHNDLPLLREVDHPVAVDPDPKLRAEALERGWKIESWTAEH